VEAAVEFAEARAKAGCTDYYAAIGRLEDAALIAEGKKGTVIVPG